jgi:hypothetical protein
MASVKRMIIKETEKEIKKTPQGIYPIYWTTTQGSLNF